MKEIDIYRKMLAFIENPSNKEKLKNDIGGLYVLYCHLFKTAFALRAVAPTLWSLKPKNAKCPYWWRRYTNCLK